MAIEFQNGGPLPEVLVFKDAFPSSANPNLMLPMLVFKEMVEASGNCYEFLMHAPVEFDRN